MLDEGVANVDAKIAQRNLQMAQEPAEPEPVKQEEDDGHIETVEEVKEDLPIELSEEDKEIATQIEDLLETRVRPSVASHGGDIVFHNYAEGIVELEMRGACSGCPSSMATLKMGVENMLKHYIPEIMEVREVE